MPLRQFPGFSEEALAEVIEATRFGGAEVIKRKRGTFYAVAPMITQLIRSIRLDEKRILPVSTRLDGSYLGIKDVALSIPWVIGKNGPETPFTCRWTRARRRRCSTRRASCAARSTRSASSAGCRSHSRSSG